MMLNLPPAKGVEPIWTAVMFAVNVVGELTLTEFTLIRFGAPKSTEVSPSTK